jgi:hypothetical protein
MTEPAEAFSDDGEKMSLPASPTVTVVVGRDIAEAVHIGVQCRVNAMNQSRTDVTCK